ncbi:MAG: hypothetical protein LWW87_09600 [Geobacteraceae bacterium]|nr:hypothetical protein [Geobacteraceae bacterium]
MRLILLTLFFFSLSLTSVVAATKPADGERLLLIRAVGGATSEKEQTAQAGVYDSMVEYLTDRGYRVVDRAAAEKASIQIAATHEIDPVLNKAASYGLTFLAEYTIHFKTSTIVKDPEKGIGALVRVSAKIVDNTGARIISVKLAEASSGGHTTEDAIDKAARSAGKKLTELLSKGLEQHVSQNGNEGRTVTMVFEGREAQTGRLVILLEKNQAVAAVKEVETGGGKTTLEIICKTRRDLLERELLRLAAQQGIQLQKIRSEGNRSTWKIK